MWRKINELGFPVLIHMGTARIVRPYDLYPSGIRKILKSAPDIPIIMAHMGSFCMMKNPDEDLENLPENVFLDTAMSAELEEAGEFEEILGRFGTNRVLYGSDFPVNSAHHQGIGYPGRDLFIIQYAPDDVPEAIIHKTLPILGVQWHPERMCFEHRRTDTPDGSLLLTYFLSLIP